jgi:hypothetical protein
VHLIVALIVLNRYFDDDLNRFDFFFIQYINEPVKPQSLQRLRREASWQNDRTYAYCHFFTATGRMIVVNPPLQHVPKRFVIQSLQQESIVRLRKMIIARTGN